MPKKRKETASEAETRRMGEAMEACFRAGFVPRKITPHFGDTEVDDCLVYFDPITPSGARPVTYPFDEMWERSPAEIVYDLTIEWYGNEFSK